MLYFELYKPKVTDNENEFMNTRENMVFNSSDIAMEDLANKYFGYKRKKGLDFIAKFNGIYILGEAKFLTDFGNFLTQCCSFSVICSFVI